MSLTMAYCADHKRFIEESNCYVGLFELLLVCQWMESGRHSNFNEPCAVCAAGETEVRETMAKTVELEARALQNGCELNTDKISIKL